MQLTIANTAFILISINKYNKPMSKKSRYRLLFSESCRGCECSNKAILNGLMRVGRTIGNYPVMPDGIFIR